MTFKKPLYLYSAQLGNRIGNPVELCRSNGEKEIDFWTALCSSTEYRVAALFRGLPSPSVELQRAFLF